MTDAATGDGDVKQTQRPLRRPCDNAEQRLLVSPGATAAPAPGPRSTLPIFWGTGCNRRREGGGRARRGGAQGAETPMTGKREAWDRTAGVRYSALSSFIRG